MAARPRLLLPPTVLHLQQRQPALRPWAVPLLPVEHSLLLPPQPPLALRPLLPLPLPLPPLLLHPLPAPLPYVQLLLWLPQLQQPRLLPLPPVATPLPLAQLHLQPAGWCSHPARAAAAQ